MSAVAGGKGLEVRFIRYPTVFLTLLLVSSAFAERHIYVADHENKKALKIKDDGTVLWECPNGNGHDIQLLPNGNVLIVNGPIVQEVAPDKSIVWEAGKP